MYHEIQYDSCSLREDKGLSMSSKVNVKLVGLHGDLPVPLQI
jgi:hypothetical protein